MAEVPVKERVWDRNFRQRSTWRWNKFDFVGEENKNWEPEDPPKMPTNNPWVDRLEKQPDAPETQQKCWACSWKHDKRFSKGIKYEYGRPILHKEIGLNL